MIHSHKLILNTFALCIKIFIKAIVLFISTKIVLNVLGASDFGLYNLIAGVISLLSFLNGSLMISTQRFLSYSIGENNHQKLLSIFNVSLLIHIIVALILGIILASLQPLLFNGFINVGDATVEVGKIIYNIMIITSITTIATIPYSATINAHEDMIFFSISEVLVILIQLLAAIIILFIDSNHLVWYTLLMMGSIFIGFISKYIWCKIKYIETCISFKLAFNKELIKDMLGFIGWNTLGSIAVLTRNQGVAVVLNHFFGTISNAAYGIANQINSLVLTFSSTLTTVFTPSIIQNKGAGNDEKMLSISLLSSKLSFLLSSVMAIPILWNLDSILNIWLGKGKVPENTSIFSTCIMLAFLFTQLYPGLNRAIYATGKIKGYQIAISIFLTLTIPIGIIAFQLGLPAQSILWVLVVSQICCFLSTIYFAQKFLDLNVKSYLRNNAIPSVTLCAISIIIGTVVSNLITNNEIILCICSILVTIIYVYWFYKIVLSKKEQKMLINLFNQLMNRS